MSRTDQLAGTHLAPDPADLERLVAGAHHNPHGILGAHEYADHTVIRAFRPHAVEVVAIVGDDRFPLQHVEAGLFAVALPFTNLIDYRLQVSYEGSDPYTVADAYRFLPTLGEVDLHLFAEGRHERLWEVLGAHPPVIHHGRRRGQRGVFRRVGAERQGRQSDRRIQRLDRQRRPDAGAGLLGRMGIVLARISGGRSVQVPGARRRRRCDRPSRPVRVRHRGAAADRIAGDDEQTTPGTTTNG